MKLKNNQQWNNWTLPSKASYLGLYIGIAGTFIGVIGISLAIFFYIYPPKSPPTSADKFFQYNNPTTINPTKIEILKWMGDKDHSVTIHYKNESNRDLPATKFTANVEVGGKQLKRFTSRAFDKIDMNTIAIMPQKTLQLPVLSVGELTKLFKENICGIGFKPIDLNTATPKRCKSSKFVNSSMIEITANYTTVLNEKKELNSKVWVYHCEDCKSVYEPVFTSRILSPEESRKIFPQLIGHVKN